jgi:hypothetical protein
VPQVPPPSLLEGVRASALRLPVPLFYAGTPKKNPGRAWFNAGMIQGLAWFNAGMMQGLAWFNVGMIQGLAWFNAWL